MPAALLRLLPQIGLALALLAALWWIDRQGYRRAMADRDRRDARLIEAVRSDLRRSEARLAGSIAAFAADYESSRAAIARRRASVQPQAMREIAHAARLADPDLGLTPGLLDAVNRARAAGACAAAAAGGAACPLPAARPDR